jgi:hypothetical protein
MNHKEETMTAMYKSDEILGFVTVEYDVSDSEGQSNCNPYGCNCIAFEKCGIFGC